MCVRKLLILLFVAFSVSCDFKTASDYLNEAEKLSDKGLYEEANKLLDKAIEKDKGFLGAYINRGVNKSAMGDFEGAIADYKIVLDSDPDNMLALLNSGNDYKRLEDYQQAIVIYDRALGTRGDGPLYLSFDRDNMFGLGEFDVPDCQIRFERAIAYYYTANLKQAYRDFSLCIDDNYLVGECYYWIGYIYVSTGNLKLACENFNKSKQFGDEDAQRVLDEYCK